MYQILVVDDSVLDVDCITFLIKKYELPLEVTTAVNGQDARSFLENLKIIMISSLRISVCPFSTVWGCPKR